ncbi:MAG: hypothetical protein SW833_01600 [Cyanobacteriota bacterium]|nr:hypothetical protein [Cyanobacteriota bacterium]
MILAQWRRSRTAQSAPWHDEDVCQIHEGTATMFAQFAKARRVAKL